MSRSIEALQEALGVSEELIEHRFREVFPASYQELKRAVYLVFQREAELRYAGFKVGFLLGVMEEREKR